MREVHRVTYDNLYEIEAEDISKAKEIAERKGGKLLQEKRINHNMMDCLGVIGMIEEKEKNLVPNTDDTYDIGPQGKRFNNSIIKDRKITNLGE